MPLALAACVSRTSPTPISRNLRFQSVVVGSLHACGLGTSGNTYCWGENSAGQLGDGTLEYRRDIVLVAGPQRLVQLSLRSERSCGVTAAGELYCWGSNPTAQVTPGLKALEESRRAASVRVADSLTLAAVAVGDRHVCGLTPTGRVYCWGDGRGGQLGLGSRDNSALPVLVPLADSIASLSAGADFTCGLTAAGRAWCWGFNADGQLGAGSREPLPGPSAVAGDLRFQQLSAGARHACGLTAAGEAYCWGWNFNLQLGAPSGERCGGGYPCSSRPLRVAGAPLLVSLSAGSERSCGLTSLGQAYCWGGRSPVLPDSAPQAWQPNPILPNVQFASIAAGGWRTCGVTRSGEALCVSNRLGLPAPRTQAPIPWLLVLYTAGGGLLGLALIWVIARARGEPPSLRDLIFAGFYGALGGFLLRVVQVLGDLFRNLG